MLGDTFGANMQIQVPVTGLMTLNGAWGMGSGGYQGIRVYEGTLSATGNGSTALRHRFCWFRRRTGVFFRARHHRHSNQREVKVQSSATEGGTYADEATPDF